MNLLEDLAPFLPVKLKDLLLDERNVLRVPATAPSVRHGPLLHDDAGAVTAATPPERACVFLGPGATFDGIADVLRPLFVTAATGGGPAAPTRDELARALVVYAKDHLPVTDWRHHQVGFRLVLPVEIEPGTGAWTVDAGKIGALATGFNPAWRAHLRTPPTPLDGPDPFVLESAAAAVVAASPSVDDLAQSLWERALRNPFECVLHLYATLRALNQTRPGDVVPVALAMLRTAVPSQAALLAGTSAGNAILRRLAAVLKDVPAGTDPRLAGARKLGSLGKIAPLYAAFELRLRLQKLVDEVRGDIPDLTFAGWERPILREVREVWFGRIAKGFPGLDTGPERMPKLDTLFEFDHTGTAEGTEVRFRRGPATDAEVNAAGSHGAITDRMKFHQWLTSMTLWSHNQAASFVIDAIGLPYLNSVLREGGFFDAETGQGIWISSNYARKGEWMPKTDFMPLSGRGTRHYKDTTNFTASARQVARLLALLARNELFNGDTTTCGDMLPVLKKKHLPGFQPNAMFTWITQALDAAPGAVTYDSVHSKIGIGDASTRPPGRHDCAIVERHVGAKVYRYVVVALGGYMSEKPIYAGFVKELDGCIVAVNP